MWSPTKLNFLFYVFFDLLRFFKDLAKINKKEKDKISFETTYNQSGSKTNGFKSSERWFARF
jgi:hypothetical protein